MIETIVILGLLKYLINYLFKQNSSILCCGIFGQATNSPKKINESNIKILGMFNESRGKSSCGITYDGELYHGMDKDKLFSDFIKGRSFKPRTIPVVFGHTRQSSVGIVSEFNCHPFGFGQNRIGDGYKFIMCHNGTLLNYKELAVQYDIEDSEKYKNTNGVEMTRFKIDSEVIGEILFKSRSFRVLSEYNGRAALVWTDTDNPNITYLWSGKSKARSDDDVSTAEEERPLNVYIENKNSFYFSSLPEALHAIGGNVKNTFQIDYNTVYVVKDGNFADARKIPISRRNNHHSVTYGSYGREAYNYKNSAFITNHANASAILKREHAFKELNKDNESLLKLPLPNMHNIYDDKALKAQNEYNGKVYPQKLRFWQNGHLIQGIYIYVPDYGYYLIGEKNLEANMTLMKLAGVPFVGNRFDTFHHAKEGDGKILFTSMSDAPKLYYFVEGVPMEYSADYQRCLDLKKSLVKGVYLDHTILSHGSLLPVVQVEWITKTITSQGIIKNGNKFTGAVDFLGFEKMYTIKDGNLVGFAKKETLSLVIRPVIQLNSGTNSKVKSPNVTSSGYNPSNLEKVYDNISDFEKEIQEFEEEIKLTKNINLKKDDKLSNDSLTESYLSKEEIDIEITKQDDGKFLNSLHEDMPPSDQEIDEEIQCIINENLVEPLKVFQETAKILEKHLPHPLAKEANSLMTDIAKLLETFIIKS